MWAGPLHNRQFIEKLQGTVDSLDESVYVSRPRINGILSLASEVSPLISILMQELDQPLYRTPGELARTVRAETPPLNLVWSALINAGYKVSSTHCCAGAFKTDAPPSFLWDMMRAWVCTCKL
jgi:tRNA (guanine26-N2/guanine27-N2)-dimethyltransferase